MGFITDDNRMEIHELTCPRAQVLKAGYGQRIVATEWGVCDDTFLIRVLVEGIDRQGILTDITHKISTELGLDLRGLEIAAAGEVFTCRLSVKVHDTTEAASVLKSLAQIDGVSSTARIES